MAPPIFGLNKLPSRKVSRLNNLRKQNANMVANGPNNVANALVSMQRFFESCSGDQAEVSDTEPSPHVPGVDRVATPSTSPLTSVCLSYHEGEIDDGHLDRNDPASKTSRSSRKTSDIDIIRADDYRTGGATGDTRRDWETSPAKHAHLAQEEEKFVPSYETFATPDICRQKKLKYKAPDSRAHGVVAPPSSIARPNFTDILRRVAVVLYGHITRCERRRLAVSRKEGASQMMQQEKRFHEKNFISPTMRYNLIQPSLMAMPGWMFTVEKVFVEPEIPSVEEIHAFVKNAFVKTYLSSECSVICLIYIERLMEVANVPLLACNWKPLLLGGLLLASKMWQDISGWNVDFSSACPEYPVKSINKLEMEFLGAIGWDLTISREIYARYYFALRSVAEEKQPRLRYIQVTQNDKARHAQAPDSAWDLLSKSL